MLYNVLNTIHDNPSLLKEKNGDMKMFLKKQGNPESQGTGNAPTDQESAFAAQLEKFGYKFVPKGADIPKMNGNYYFYQPKGTQRNIDFMAVDVLDGKETVYYLDLKHTTGKTFFFNDGWFEDDVIYIVSFTMKKVHKVYIGYGKDTRTDEEHSEMLEMIMFKQKWNKTKKNVGNLKKCIRYANQYSCDGFTPEFIHEKFKSVQTKLSSSVPSSV
jgi:hypothetical protein